MTDDMQGLIERLRAEERAHRSGLPGARRVVADLMDEAAEALSTRSTDVESAPITFNEAPVSWNGVVASRLRGSARALREANWKAPTPLAARVIADALSTAYANGERYGREASAKLCDKLARGMEGSGQADGAAYLATAIRAAEEQSHGE